MSRVVIDGGEEAIISLVTNVSERWRCRRPEAETNTPTHEALESGTVSGICIAQPGLRGICQFGDNCGLEDVVDDTVL